MHDDCVTLAKLHSDAVDYSKSGIPVPMDEVPRPEGPREIPERPDWLEPETGFRTRVKVYKSQKAIGHLFREIDLRSGQSQGNVDDEEDMDSELDNGMGTMSLNDDSTNDSIRRCLRSRMSEFIYDDRITKNRRSHLETLFADYVERLKQICSTYSLRWRRSLSEEEALVGTIKARTSDPRRRRYLTSKLREQTNQLVADVIDEMIGEENMPADKRMAVAFFSWELSSRKGEKFGARSFSWIALVAFFLAMKDAEDEDKAAWSRIRVVYPVR